MFNFFLLIFCIYVIDAGDQTYKYFQDVNRWRMHSMADTWTEARFKCEIEGATLASPVTPQMLEVMIGMMKDSGIRCNIFVGLNKIETKEFYFTPEGIPLSKVSAKLVTSKNQCSKNIGDCLVLRADGTLTHADCSDSYPYICHKTDSRRAPKSSCYIFDLGYELDHRTGSCYKFHNIKSATDHYDALDECTLSGGQLAIINSDEEAEVIKELFEKHQHDSSGEYLTDVVHIGVNQFGKLWTNNGQPLDEAGYNRWAPNQPNLTNSPNCAGVTRKAELDDLNCNKKLGYICEVPPNNDDEFYKIRLDFN